jgi:GT2 family glycosyltransferase
MSEERTGQVRMPRHRPPRIVLLGIMSRKPVAGVIWQTLQYLLGLRRLGFDVYYVEAHGLATGLLMQSGQEGEATAAAFIDGVMRRFDLGDRWAFHAVYSGRRCYGLDEGELGRLYESAELIINLHGATVPLPEHSARNRLVYLETDPVLPQIELYHNVRETIAFLEPHCAYFTYAENYGRPGCGLPVSDRFEFRPTRPPILLDLWQTRANGARDTFTTVGSWRQLNREIEFKGEVYHWSKHFEFMKYLDLPALAGEEFELALNRYDGDDRRLLESKGWSVRDALDVSLDPEVYLRYIAESRGEFTVAKDQNVRLRTGWFSDRSASYLAAGRPVVTQETGFSGILPTGEGLFSFVELDEAVEAIENVNSDYERHCRAASELAREYFGHDVVLGRLLADLGIPSATGAPQPAKRTVEARDGFGAERPEPDDSPGSSPRPRCSVIIPVHNNASLTRRCLDALLGDAGGTDFETIVVDDASTDATGRLLEGYAGRVRTVRHATNRGFAAACNTGAATASGEYLVFLNNDVLPEAGWLDALVRYVDNHPTAAVVGSKLLFPNGTIQHAGVTICHDRYPRHIYAGFPADHPAVNRSRRFQAVTGASVLIRRIPFEEAGGFDEAFLNGFEDVDLCLRLDKLGHEVHYCHESVGQHLEAVSDGRFVREKKNLALFRERWNQNLRPDDLEHYIEDGLLTLGYASSYPVKLGVSPLLAALDGAERENQADRLLNLRSQQVFELLKETIRLTVLLQKGERHADAEEDNAGEGGGHVALSRFSPGVRPGVSPALAGKEELREALLEAHWQLLRRDEELEALAHDIQSGFGGKARDGTTSFVPGKYLGYRQLVRRIRCVASEELPPGATVIVVSRGDEALLELGEERKGWHFPQDKDGVYAGYYPADSSEAVAHLEQLRCRGAGYLLLPETSLWWLDHYPGVREHLESRFRPLVQVKGTCLIFDLRKRAGTVEPIPPTREISTSDANDRSDPVP